MVTAIPGRAAAASATLLLAVALALVAPDPGQPATAAARTCKRPDPGLPRWARERRATVLVDSVPLSGYPALRGRRPCWKLRRYGRPALMIGIAARELRAAGRRVAPLAIVGLGYNSLWERRRRRFDHWARRFAVEALQLLRTLRALGARQIIWVTLREPTARTVPPSSRHELGQYSWYFPYVNGRLRHLNRRHDDLALANWKVVSDRPGLTYDSIHLDTDGAALMARTVWRAVSREARRQTRAKRSAGAPRFAAAMQPRLQETLRGRKRP